MKKVKIGVGDKFEDGYCQKFEIIAIPTNNGRYGEKEYNVKHTISSGIEEIVNNWNESDLRQTMYQSKWKKI